MNILIKLSSVFLVSLFIFSCSKIDPVTGEKVLIDPNEKIEQEKPQVKTAVFSVMC
jgi:hypothetical protein